MGFLSHLCKQIPDSQLIHVFWCAARSLYNFVHQNIHILSSNLFEGEIALGISMCSVGYNQVHAFLSECHSIISHRLLLVDYAWTCAEKKGKFRKFEKHQ